MSILLPGGGLDLVRALFITIIVIDFIIGCVILMENPKKRKERVEDPYIFFLLIFEAIFLAGYVWCLGEYKGRYPDINDFHEMFECYCFTLLLICCFLAQFVVYIAAYILGKFKKSA